MQAPKENRIVVVGDAGDDLSSVISLLRDAGHRVVHYDASVPMLAIAGALGNCGTEPDGDLVVGDFVLDASLHVLRHGLRSFPLTPRQFFVMLALMRSPDRTVPREVLCREAGIRNAKPSARGRSLDMQIVHLRRFIEVDSRRPKHIVTIRQVGYRLRTQSIGRINGRDVRSIPNSSPELSWR